MRHARRSGMTLIEVQVALLILLVGVLTAVGLAPMGMRGVDVAGDATFVTAAARHAMEATQALPFAQRAKMGLADPTLRVFFTANEALGDADQPHRRCSLDASCPAEGTYAYTVSVEPLEGRQEVQRIEILIYRERTAVDMVLKHGSCPTGLDGAYDCSATTASGAEVIYRLVTYRAALDS